MILFIALMLVCTAAILCAARAVDGKAGLALGLIMLALQGAAISTYSTYLQTRAPLSERIMTECEGVEVGSDVGPILEDAGYTLEFLGTNVAGSPQYVAWSPACGE